jgi:two-component system nitrogen regulation response regulator GlnG
LKHVLVIDDEAAICWGFQQFLGDAGHAVTIAGTAEDGLRAAEQSAFDAVVLDVRLPGMDGLTALQEFRRKWPRIPVTMMTAFGDLDTAVKAIQNGAFEYLTKPFSLDQAAAVIERALAANGSPTETAPRAFDSESPLLGSSPEMQRVFKEIALAAASDLPVLIGGETGTGKELVARAIHRHGRQSRGGFVPVFLGALNEAVIESELFGHVRGAFTGATEDRSGLIAQAAGGTLFLDEIGDAPAAVQVKLLRFLETGEYFPVGSSTPRQATARVLAATHRRLPELVAEGTFREDLYFRLRGWEITLPALRERVSDILLLAAAFWKQASPDRGDFTLSAEVQTALCERLWPGNVRELRATIERAALLARGGPLVVEHLLAVTPRDASFPALPLDQAVTAWIGQRLAAGIAEGDLLRTFFGVVETPMLAAVLSACHGNRAAAARMLGIDRTTLRSKLRAYGLDSATEDG